MGRCHILLENEINIFKKLVSRRKHEVLQKFLVNGCSDVSLKKTMDQHQQMTWIYLIHEFHNLSWIFHDILIYWDAPVYYRKYYWKTKVKCVSKQNKLSLVTRCHVLMAIEKGETIQITCFAWFYQICNQLCTKQKGEKIISKLCVNFWGTTQHCSNLVMKGLATPYASKTVFIRTSDGHFLNDLISHVRKLLVHQSQSVTEHLNLFLLLNIFFPLLFVSTLRR